MFYWLCSTWSSFEWGWTSTTSDLVRFLQLGVYIFIMSQESDEALDLLPVEELEQEGGWNFSDWTNSSPRIDVEEDNGLEEGDCDSTSTDSS